MRNQQLEAREVPWNDKDATDDGEQSEKSTVDKQRQSMVAGSNTTETSAGFQLGSYESSR